MLRRRSESVIPGGVDHRADLSQD